MIKLYTLAYVKKPEQFINSHEELFKNTVLNEELTNRDIEIIKQIDNAEYLGNNTIRGKFNKVTSINNISRGCKIALNLRWLLQNKPNTIHKVNITSCGDNVFPVLIQEIGDNDIEVLTYNYGISCAINTNIIVNDKYKIKNFTNLLELGEKLYETCN